MPFCPGCGHGLSVRSIGKALTALGYNPKDIIIVSDIGCSGLVDPLFATHTIHGLHGRAPALGLGIALGLNNPEKQVVVIQGDGGATIGLQHLMEAARRNVNMTLVVMNNLLYGMTGGQISGLSTQKFKEIRNFEQETPPFDVVRLAHEAGAAYANRVNSPRYFNEHLQEAISTDGFSLIELSSLCPSYGLKKMDDLLEIHEEDSDALKNHRHPVRAMPRQTKSLLDSLEAMPAQFESSIEGKFGVVLAGSAGGGVQAAARLLANAGLLAGLHATMKGEYPITVGTGFSVAEVILSREKINYTGLEKADMMIVLTDDGFTKVKDRITPGMDLIMDASVTAAKNVNGAVRGNFQQTIGKRGAALSAIGHWLDREKLLPKEALLAAAGKHKYADSLLKAIESGNKVAIGG